ncbi:SurA N-terminal domain-containing protein [Candidatus Saccharibacteria bacterium]|nr:SurA N-terminal domain-containing protein [Candidatus Saccharibacteria bacterium]
MGRLKAAIKGKLPGKTEHKTEKEKLDKRREEVLAHGRKFKYPLQFAKHRLVFITIAIALVALIGAGVFGWVSLYKMQNTGDVLYRLTTILPVPVAKIDGEYVRYSDYLMIFRSSITPVEQQNGASDTQTDVDSVREYYKRVALNDAEDYTYALKLAKQMNITVSNEMIDEAFDEHRKLGGAERSREGFLKVLKDNFNLTEKEYRRLLYLSLVKEEVSKKIDTAATAKAEEAYAKAKLANGNLSEVASALGLEYEDTGGLVDVMNVDGGRSDVAYSMQPNQLSSILTSSNGDGYYIIYLREKAESKVNYASIKIPFTEFARRLANVREENRVEEYITIGDSEEADEAQADDER